MFLALLFVSADSLWPFLSNSLSFCYPLLLLAFVLFQCLVILSFPLSPYLLNVFKCHSGPSPWQYFQLTDDFLVFLQFTFSFSLLISGIFDDPVLLFFLDPYSLLFYLMILCFSLTASVGFYLSCICSALFRKPQLWVYHLTQVCICFCSVDISSHRKWIESYSDCFRYKRLQFIAQLLIVSD